MVTLGYPLVSGALWGIGMAWDSAIHMVMGGLFCCQSVANGLSWMASHKELHRTPSVAILLSPLIPL